MGASTDHAAGPRIVGRRTTSLSRWFTVVEKDVVFPWSAGRHTYHAVGTLPYSAVYAVTPDLRVPLIRQFRPAVERFTWELPAGLVDDQSSAEDTCRRELLEEAGVVADSLTSLGTFDIDTGRFEGVQHLFLAHGRGPAVDFRAEKGTEVAYVPEAEVPEWITAGRITSLPHIGAVHLARTQRVAEGWSAG